MRKTREVLRLYFELRLGQRKIARGANLSQITVHDYLERFRATRTGVAATGRDVRSGAGTKAVSGRFGRGQAGRQNAA